MIALLGAGLLAGGSNYLNGFKANILTPVAHTSSPLSVLSSTWYWAGILVILAAGGVVISAVRREGRAATWLLAVLAAAAILGPAEQAWLHTAALLNEHVGVGGLVRGHRRRLRRGPVHRAASPPGGSRCS